MNAPTIHSWVFPVTAAIVSQVYNGCTEDSLKLFDQYAKQLGKVEQVELIMPFGSGQSECLTRLINAKGHYMQLDGFSWGYGGEGPRGLHTVFKRIGLPITFQEIAAWSSEHIRIDVSNPVIMPPCQCVIKVREDVKRRMIDILKGA